MKLVHPELKQVFEFTEEQVNVWVIENPAAFYQYIMQLFKQISGKEGKFVLSHEMKELKISKQMDILLEPWSMDFSSRKILGRLYEEIKEIAWESENFINTKEMMSDLNRYVLDLEHKLPYDIECPEEIDFVQLLKALDIKLEVDAETLLEQLVLYIKLCRRLLHIQVLVLVNIKSYLNKDELVELYKIAAYEKVYLLLLESVDRESIDVERKYVIDNDMCEIFC